MGIDLGSQKTMVVNQEADILLTDTGNYPPTSLEHSNLIMSFPLGSVTRPTLIAFLGRNRLLGEEAIPQKLSENAIASFNLVLGKSFAEIQKSALFPHRKSKFSEDNGRVLVTVSYNGAEHQFSVPALVGMFLAKLAERVTEVHGSNFKLAFAVPPTATPQYHRALLDSCEIAHLDAAKIALYSSSDCLVATYARKINGLRPPERVALEGKCVVLIDVGHTSALVVVVRAHEPVKGGNDGKGPLKLGEAYSDVVGGAIFDVKMYNHFVQICESKHATQVLFYFLYVVPQFSYCSIRLLL